MDTWIIIGSGPNRQEWKHFYNLAPESKIFCMNGSLIEHKNPNAFICTDKRFIAEYAKRDFSKKTTVFFGFESVALALGTDKINNMPVRNVGTWAIYLALKYFHAKEIHVFGIYGVEKQHWTTLSTVPGIHSDKAKFNADTKALSESPRIVKPAETVFNWNHETCRYNDNAAELIIYMRKKFPAEIVVHGGGPIADLIKNIEASNAKN